MGRSSCRRWGDVIVAQHGPPVRESGKCQNRGPAAFHQFRAGRVGKSRHFSQVSAWLAGMAFGTFRVPDGPDEAVSGLAQRLPNPRNLHAGATRPSGAPCARSTWPPRRYRHVDGAHDLPSTAVLERASASARRSARQCPRRYRGTLVGSVTTASSFILPLQHGHVSTSNPKVRLSSSAHGLSVG